MEEQQRRSGRYYLLVFIVLPCFLFVVEGQILWLSVWGQTVEMCFSDLCLDSGIIAVLANKNDRGSHFCFSMVALHLQEKIPLYPVNGFIISSSWCGDVSLHHFCFSLVYIAVISTLLPSLHIANPVCTPKLLAKALSICIAEITCHDQSKPTCLNFPS